MDPAFSLSNYVIKPQGLSLGGKYCVYGPQNEPVLYVEFKTKWKAPYQTYHVYSDEKKQHEVLQIQDRENTGFVNYFDVTDIITGGKVGGVSADWSKFFEDAWCILNAEDAVIGRVRESSAGRAILHELTNGALPQTMKIMMGDQQVAELKQKSVMMGHHLLVDFSMDTTGSLDRRLGLAAAFIIAVHQTTTESA